MNKIFVGCCFFLLTSTQNLWAQIVIGTPSLGFGQACASTSFNTYNTTFSFSPESALSSTNQFIVELSDSSGNFENPTVVFTSSPGVVTVSPATLTFSLQTSIAGEAYKLRIKSTGPVARSSNSIAFAAYYKFQDSPFSINDLISRGSYCTGGSYLLTIDNPGTGLNDSPLQYPSLTFNWYKETSPTTSVFVSSGPSLSVNQPGIYFVATNYGSCTSNSFSNHVTISDAGSGSDATIVSNLGNPFCSSNGPTTLTTTAGNNYQWIKDGTEIPGATNQTYITDEAGIYSVNINLGSCTANASIDLQNEAFTSSINVLETNIIEPGETLIVTTTTTALNPEYEWYFNDALLEDAIESTFEAEFTGNYKVVITQTSGCITSKEFLFEINEGADPFPDVAKIPNLISPNGDNINDTWIIPKEYVSTTNTKIIIMSPQGEIVLKTNDYQNNWPEYQLNFKNINLVYYYIITTQDNKTKKGSITIIK